MRELTESNSVAIIKLAVFVPSEPDVLMFQDGVVQAVVQLEEEFTPLHRKPRVLARGGMGFTGTQPDNRSVL